MHKTRRMTLCALFTALCAVCAQIMIPTQPVAMNLALLAVHLAGALLSPGQALWSMTAYLLMGALGLPVFAGFRGGMGVLLDRTGGYILGYAGCAWLESRLLEGRKSSIPRMVFSMAVGTLLCYLLGTVWFMLLTATPLWTSLSLCVLPFLPGDAAKILLAALLARRLRIPLMKIIN